MNTQFTTLLSKYEDALSDFKRKRRYAYINDEDYTEYNTYINKLEIMIELMRSRVSRIDAKEDSKRVRDLIDEYNDVSDVREELIESIHEELENMDKSEWYTKNFENWRDMPPRQDCDDHSIIDRLHYSKCRRTMFNHLEHSWKRETFPTLAHRLEFF